MSDEPWSQASIDACVSGLEATLRQWPTQAVLQVFTTTAELLTERGEWAAALEQACGRTAAGAREEAVAAAAITAIAAIDERVELLRETNASELPRGCLFGTAISALGVLALLVAGFGALVVVCWRLILGAVR